MKATTKNRGDIPRVQRHVVPLVRLRFGRSGWWRLPRRSCLQSSWLRAAAVHSLVCLNRCRIPEGYDTALACPGNTSPHVAGPPQIPLQTWPANDGRPVQVRRQWKPPYACTPGTVGKLINASTAKTTADTRLAGCMQTGDLTRRGWEHVEMRKTRYYSREDSSIDELQ